MITLNQVIKNLNNIASAHYQINSFGNGNVTEFATSGTTNYPAMWVDYQPAQVQGGAYLHVVTIYISDRMLKGNLNELEVLSDMQQVCLDVIAQCRSNIYGWSLVSDSVTLNPFYHTRFDDETAGYFFDLTLRIPFTYDRCQIPFSGSLSSAQFGGTCEPVTILNQNNEIITTISSGGTYSVIQVSSIDGGSSNTTYTNSIIQA
jgi:hypothetical protein